MIATSFAEVLSIGSTLPFLGILTMPEKVTQNAVVHDITKLLDINSPSALLLALTIGYGVAALLAGAFRLTLLWATNKLSHVVGSELSNEIYRRTLYQPYEKQISRNSSELISGISVKVNELTFGIQGVLNLIASFFLLIFILTLLLMVNSMVAISAFVSFGLIYAAITAQTRKRLKANSKVISTESSGVVKALQEGLGGIRDVLINGTQEFYCEIYRKSDNLLRAAKASNQFIYTSPRYVIEALGMVLIAGLAYGLASSSDGIAATIPVLGVLAMGAQRLLPVLQQAYTSIAGMRGSHSIMCDALELLEQPMPYLSGGKHSNLMTFESDMLLNNVSYKYQHELPWAIRDATIRIEKGECIGFIGATGSGKSTIIDIIMGLLEPSNGTLEIDGQVVTSRNRLEWQSHIGHVPQSIYLADCSILENIGLGIPRDYVDLERAKLAAHKARIATFIEELPEKYNTFVGENGVRLSGGQRQRIGIARALYKNSDVIIFDEATSALDDKTEKAVMEAIDDIKGGVTVLIVAHRISTLKNCHRVVELVNGKIVRVCSYDEVENKNE